MVFSAFFLFCISYIANVNNKIHFNLQEAEAFALYHKALDLQKHDKSEESAKAYHELLRTPLLKEVSTGSQGRKERMMLDCTEFLSSSWDWQAQTSEDEKVGLKHPGLMLKYSTYKNLASLAVQRDDLGTAMDFYLEVMV